MFEIRPHNSEMVLKRQLRSLIEISAPGKNIPLQENWMSRWCSLPDDFEKIFESIYEFAVKKDDVFVVTFPKCGTTWTQELVWLLMNDLNFGDAKQKDLHERSTFLDLSGLYSDNPTNSVKSAAALKSPRIIKSHLPAHLLPHQIWDKKTKIVYCARNPKDVAVSFCHFHKGLGTWKGEMDDFIEDFINDDIMYTPYWPSVIDFWKMRNEPNIFFTSFEEMKKDLSKVLKKLTVFLEKPPLRDFEIQALMGHLSFDSMKENKCTNPTEVIRTEANVLPDFQFMRRGIVGSYKDELSSQNQKKLDDWTNNFLSIFNITPQDIFGAY